MVKETRIVDLLDEALGMSHEQMLIMCWNYDLDMEPDYLASLERWASYF